MNKENLTGLPNKQEVELDAEIAKGEPTAEILGNIVEFSNKMVSYESRRYARM